MSLLQLMHNYARYNLWANETLAGWLLQKPGDALDDNVPSSYPSINKTVAHLLDTERFWLAILRGEARQPWQEYEGPDAIRELLQQSKAFAAYVQSLSEPELLAGCELDARWAQGKLPRYEFIQHCINHGAYHRGQVITIARNLGLSDPPTTDYNYYNMAVMREGFWR